MKKRRLTDVGGDVILTSFRRWHDAMEVREMGPDIRQELGRLRLEDLLHDAEERSTRTDRGASPRRPRPRVGGEER
jgi:hypothetical protein